MRKTIEIKELVNIINHKLTLDIISQDQKEAMCVILERVLHDTGNYRGYTYLFDWNSLPLEQARAMTYNRMYYVRTMKAKRLTYYKYSDCPF